MSPATRETIGAPRGNHNSIIKPRALSAALNQPQTIFSGRYGYELRPGAGCCLGAYRGILVEKSQISSDPTDPSGFRAACSHACDDQTKQHRSTPLNTDQTKHSNQHLLLTPECRYFAVDVLNGACKLYLMQDEASAACSADPNWCDAAGTGLPASTGTPEDDTRVCPNQLCPAAGVSPKSSSLASGASVANWRDEYGWSTYALDLRIVPGLLLGVGDRVSVLAGAIGYSGTGDEKSARTASFSPMRGNGCCGAGPADPSYGLTIGRKDLPVWFATDQGVAAMCARLCAQQAGCAYFSLPLGRSLLLAAEDAKSCLLYAGTPGPNYPPLCAVNNSGGNNALGCGGRDEVCRNAALCPTGEWASYRRDDYLETAATAAVVRAEKPLGLVADDEHATLFRKRPGTGSCREGTAVVKNVL